MIKIVGNFVWFHFYNWKLNGENRNASLCHDIDGRYFDDANEFTVVTVLIVSTIMLHELFTSNSLATSAPFSISTHSESLFRTLKKKIAFSLENCKQKAPDVLVGFFI